MIHLTPPDDFKTHLGKMPSVFLAGTIDMGASVDWQAQVKEALQDKKVIILNPRRGNWDASWEQSIDNPQFRGQVEWELDALDAADLILFYFMPNSKSPISMMELGIHAPQKPKKIIVCCPHDFWRKGNVDIVCARYGVRQVATLEEAIAAVKEGL